MESNFHILNAMTYRVDIIDKYSVAMLEQVGSHACEKLIRLYPHKNNHCIREPMLPSPINPILRPKFFIR